MHLQCAAVFTVAAYDYAKRDLAALLRLLCGFQTASIFRWALKIEMHHYNTADQSTLRKVTEAGLFGYCLKQRFTSAVFKCALCSCNLAC